MAKKCPKCKSEIKFSEEPRVAMGKIYSNRTRRLRCSNPKCDYIEKGGE